MPGLADHLAAPPAAYAHLPYDPNKVLSIEPLLSLRPASVRLLACKRSWDGEALIIRLQEAVGRKTGAALQVSLRSADRGEGAPPEPKAIGQDRGHVSAVHIPVSFRPFEIKTLRVEKDGTWSAVRMIEEVC